MTVTPKLKTSMILAVSKDMCIAHLGQIPWKIPFDMAIFKEHTLGKAVIMGRHTWESMGSRPLKGRKNIVISSRSSVICLGQGLITVVPTLEAAIKAAHDENLEAVLIGGKRVYEDGILLADEVLVTEVEDVWLINHNKDYIHVGIGGYLKREFEHKYCAHFINLLHSCVFTHYVRKQQE